MPANELLRRDRLRFVARVGQRIEMMIAGDDVVGSRRDGAVSELIVVGITGDDVELKGWSRPDHIVMDGAQKAENTLNLSLAMDAATLGHNLLVFAHDGLTDSPLDLTV